MAFQGKALDKCQYPYKWSMCGEWELLKKFYNDQQKNQQDEVYGQLTTNNDTVLHVVAAAGRDDVLQFFIDLIKNDRKKLFQAFSIRNNYDNTILHEVAASGNQKAAIILMSEENKVKEEYHSYESMLAIQNNLGETPLYRAAAFGHTNLVEHLAAIIFNLQPQQQDIEQQQDIKKQQEEAMKHHFYRNHDNISILQIAVISQHFETALWLLHKYPDLADREESNGLTCLQLLAQMPYAFEAKFRKSIWKMLIYKCLFYDDNCDSERRSNQSPNQNNGLESGSNQPRNQNDDLDRRSNQPRQSSSSKKITSN